MHPLKHPVQRRKRVPVFQKYYENLPAFHRVYLHMPTQDQSHCHGKQDEMIGPSVAHLLHLIVRGLSVPPQTYIG